MCGYLGYQKRMGTQMKNELKETFKETVLERLKELH